jgi:hypothetical protein
MQWTYDKWIETSKSKTVVCGLYHKIIQGGKGLNNLTHWWLEDEEQVYSQTLNTETMQFEDDQIAKHLFYEKMQSRKIKLSTVEMEDWCDIMLKINDQIDYNHTHTHGWSILEDIKTCNRPGTKMQPTERHSYYFQKILVCRQSKKQRRH